MTSFYSYIKDRKKKKSPFRSGLLVVMLFCSFLLVACSDSPTAATNPLTAVANSEANKANATANAATTTPASTGSTNTSAVATANPASAQSGSSTGSGSGAAGSVSTVPAASTTSVAVGRDPRQVFTLWTSGWKGNPDYENLLNNLIDTYRTKYSKNFTVDWQDFDDLPARLENALNKGPKALPVPDLVLLNAGDLYQFAAADKLQDLSALVGEDGQSRFAVPAWEAMRYSVNGNSGVYALPWLASTRVSIINKTLWQKATLDPAKLPKNFNDLDQALPLMRDKTPTDVLSVWLHPDPMVDFMMEEVPLYQVNSAGKKEAAFNIPAAQGKWQYYYDRRKDGYFVTDALTGTYNDAFNRYAASRVVMVMDGAPLLPGLKSQNAELYSNTLVTLHPLSKGNVYPLQIQGWAVPKGTANSRDAVDFAMFMDNDENQLAYAKIAQVTIPTTRKALTDAYVTGNDEPIAQARALMVQALPQSRPPEQLIPAPIPLATRDKLLNALYIAQSATWNKAVKPQDALTEAAKAWADLLK